MESPQSNLTQIIKQLLSDPRVVDDVTTVLGEMLQNTAKADENVATAPTVEQSASQPELTDIPQETVAPVSEPIAQPVQESDIRQSQEYITYSTKTDAQLRALHACRIKRNIKFTPAFQAILTDRFPTYNPELKKYTGHGGRRKQVVQPATQQPTTPSGGKERIISWLTHNSQPEKAPEQAAATAPAKTEKPAPLSVKLKLSKQSLDTAFYDVYINGKKILHNHADTELKLFADGTLLGIHGIVTKNKHLPQRPLWLIYKTDMTNLKWPGHTRFTNYSIYVQQINESESKINLSLSDKSIRMLKIELLKRQAGPTRFEIER